MSYMPFTTDPRIQKLPAWVRSGIAQLVQKRDYWEQRYKEVAAPVTEDTKVSWSDYLDGEMAIPEQGHVNMKIDTTDGDWECEIQLKRSRCGKGIEVMMSGFNGHLSIRPSSSNTFTIVAEPRR